MPIEIVHVPEPTPSVLKKSVFLAGPSPRQGTDPYWRPEAIEALRQAGFDGTVLIPLSRNSAEAIDFQTQAEWERAHLRLADVIAIWCPRDIDKLPGFTTNVEFGEWLHSGRLLYGRPEEAPNVRNLDLCYRSRNRKLKPPYNRPATSLVELARLCVESLGDGAERTAGDRAVPLLNWRTHQFQAWYHDLIAAGNRLDDAEVLWLFQIPEANNFVFSFALKVKVWVSKEERHKENEFVVSRSDISVLCAYFPDPQSHELLDTKIVLVREFRSPGRTADGFVHDLPGGSSFKVTNNPTSVAASELKEETGLQLEPSRFEKIAQRQIAATFGTHKAHLFAVKLTAAELQQLESRETTNSTFGVGSESELTYLEIRTIRQILRNDLVDHACVGMIMQSCLAAWSIKD